MRSETKPPTDSCVRRLEEARTLVRIVHPLKSSFVFMNGERRPGQCFNSSAFLPMPASDYLYTYAG